MKPQAQAGHAMRRPLLVASLLHASRWLGLALAAVLTGCAGFPVGEAPRVNLVGIESLAGEADELAAAKDATTGPIRNLSADYAD